jgi:hypothetical protein
LLKDWHSQFLLHVLFFRLSDVFPAVTIRDPYRWMGGMCRHHYGAKWAKSDHCPNLVHDNMTATTTKNNNMDNINDGSSSSSSIPVTVKYKDFVRHHSSLIHFWNEWYQHYLHASFPRLIVR